MGARAWAIVLSIAGMTCALDEERAPEAGPSAQEATAVAAAPSCEALEATLEQQLIAEMRQRLEEEKRKVALMRACGFDAGVRVAPSASPGSNPTPSPPSSVSRTNNQVAGVDEADLVKVDGNVMYVLGTAALHVLEAWPAAGTHEIARVPIFGTPRQLFVEGGRAVVYASVGARGAAACTYGYECDFLGDGSRTRVTVLDVRTPAQPQVVRELELSGSLIAARRIGTTVHTVVADPAPSLGLLYVPERYRSRCGRPPPADEVEAQFAALAAENEAKIRARELTDVLPQVTDTRSPGALPQCTGFVVPREPRGASYTSVLSFDLRGAEPLARTTLIGRPGAVYVSRESLYVAARAEIATGSETSVVHRFRVGDAPGLTRYEASGVVPGHVLNQFAMDEWQGHLRIATTRGWVPAHDTESTFSVLAQRGDALQVVGQVGQIAPGEDIRSVRFAGARGYVVTFKKTDPLFVLDLADPLAPRVLGALKIPGFSTYMHPLDDGHLLTIGYDADDQGSFAWFQGVLLQIFDVSNPQQPTQLHKTVIGTRGSSSEALTNHLAFNYFADKKLLAVPMTVCDGGQAGSFGTTMRFSGLMLFDVDLTRGIVERGRVAHPPLDGQGYRDAACSNWWTNATSNVKRSLFMDDFVYSIAPDVVRVQDLGALGRDVAAVPLLPVRAAGGRPPITP